MMTSLAMAYPSYYTELGANKAYSRMQSMYNVYFVKYAVAPLGNIRSPGNFTCYCPIGVSTFWCATQGPTRCADGVAVGLVELQTKRKVLKL